MKHKPKYKPVLIEWLDSKGVTSEWEFIDKMEPLEPYKCISIGFLLEDHPEYKTIVQNIGDIHVLGKMTIPANSILKITEVII